MIELAVLISGRGSNMTAIHRAVLAGRLQARIAVVVSDQESAPGIRYARDNGIPVEVVVRAKGESREDHDRRIIRAIETHGAGIVALAGYMRLLSPLFIRAFSGKLINIHPSLLPAFPGLHAQKQALEAGARESGCTVHFVDEGCDTGPIIAQRRVPVLPDDTETSLSERILAQEHQLYSECLQWIAEGRVRLEDKRVTIAPPPSNPK